MGMESFGGQEEELIKKATNFEELYGAIREMGELHGTQKVYGASELIELVEGVRKNVADSTLITRTGGLRGKVEDLILAEKMMESGGFNRFYNDPVSSGILEEVCLQYLKEKDADYFNREFTGELDEMGNLIRRDDQEPFTKPSMNIGGGKAMQWVIDKVNAKLNQ